MHKLCLLFFILYFVPVIGYAAPPPGQERFWRASTEFDAAIADAQTKGTMPRISDPKVLNLILTMSDVKNVLGTQAYSAKDVPALLEICGQVNRAIVSYSLFGIQKLDKEQDVSVKTQDLRRLMITNTHEFQSEIAPLGVFEIHCQARLNSGMTEMILGLKPGEFTDIRRQGLTQTRLGTVNMYVGGLINLTDFSMAAIHRERLLNALSETANDFLQLLTIANRNTIVMTAKNIRPNVADADIDKIDHIIDVMSSQDCTGLCQY